MQTGIEKEGDQLIIANVTAIRERIEKATDRQSVASCISELIGLMNTPGISWNLIMELSLALQLALERSNNIPSTAPVMPPEEIQKVLNRAKELTEFIQELEEEKKKLGELDTQMVECIKEIRDLREQWMKDPFSVEGLAIEKTMSGKMEEGIGHLATMRQIIGTREEERKQIQTMLASPEAHTDEEFLRSQLKLIEAHLVESKGLYEKNINANAREIQGYIAARSIIYNDKIPKAEVADKLEKALSQIPTEDELKPIKDYLRQHGELATGEGILPLEDFIKKQVRKEIEKLNSEEVTESKRVEPEAVKEDKKVVSPEPQVPEDRPTEVEAKATSSVEDDPFADFIEEKKEEENKGKSFAAKFSKETPKNQEAEKKEGAEKETEEKKEKGFAAKLVKERSGSDTGSPGRG